MGLGEESEDRYHCLYDRVSVGMMKILEIDTIWMAVQYCEYT